MKNLSSKNLTHCPNVEIPHRLFQRRITWEKHEETASNWFAATLFYCWLLLLWEVQEKIRQLNETKWNEKQCVTCLDGLQLARYESEVEWKEAQNLKWNRWIKFVKCRAIHHTFSAEMSTQLPLLQLLRNKRTMRALVARIQIQLCLCSCSHTSQTHSNTITPMSMSRWTAFVQEFFFESLPRIVWLIDCLCALCIYEFHAYVQEYMRIDPFRFSRIKCTHTHTHQSAHACTLQQLVRMTNACVLWYESARKWEKNKNETITKWSTRAPNFFQWMVKKREINYQRGRGNRRMENRKNAFAHIMLWSSQCHTTNNLQVQYMKPPPWVRIHIVVECFFGFHFIFGIAWWGKEAYASNNARDKHLTNDERYKNALPRGKAKKKTKETYHMRGEK